MIDRRKQRVPRTATQSKSKKSIPLVSANGSAAKDGLVSDLGTGQPLRLDTNNPPEVPRLGSGEGRIAGEKLLVADILVVDCVSASGIHSVLALLDGLRVEAVSFVGDLQQYLHGLTTEGPCAVLCVACSKNNASRDLVDVTLRSLVSQPLLVVDECFDADFGHLLLEHGALDYLDGRNLSSATLHRRSEWAILRNGPRAPTSAPWRDHAVDGDQSELRRIYAGLPPRQREVLDLLLKRLPAKQIARRLGISVKTVHAQLASLRSKFQAASSQDLIILVLGALYRE